MGLYREAMRAAGRVVVQNALDECKGNCSAAARLLGLNRTDFYKVMARMGIVPKKYEKKPYSPESTQVTKLLSGWKPPSIGV